MLAHFKLKTIPILEIKDLVFVLCSIKQQAFVAHLVLNEEPAPFPMHVFCL